MSRHCRPGLSSGPFRPWRESVPNQGSILEGGARHHPLPSSIQVTSFPFELATLHLKPRPRKLQFLPRPRIQSIGLLKLVPKPDSLSPLRNGNIHFPWRIVIESRRRAVDDARRERSIRPAPGRHNRRPRADLGNDDVAADGSRLPQYRNRERHSLKPPPRPQIRQGTPRNGQSRMLGNNLPSTGGTSSGFKMTDGVRTGRG